MLRNWVAVGLGVVVAAVTFVGGYQWKTCPATYREAVIEVLAHREITYTDLDIREQCVSHPHYRSSCIRTYHAVRVYRDTLSSGWVTCHEQRGDCYLDLATLGIVREPLRDLRGVRMLPKPLVRVAEYILAHMRALESSKRQTLRR
jgi:hypothetical protein